MKNKVILIGGSHHNTLGVLRSLGKTNLFDIILIMVGYEDDFVSHSKYIQKSNVIKIFSDELVIDTLLSIVPSLDAKAIVICCSDQSISAIDKHYNKLKKHFILPNAKNTQGEINKLMDKTYQTEIAKNIGFNMPTTLKCENKDQAKQWGIFPCIIKPEESILGSKSDIKICHDKESLITTIRNIHCKAFQIQQFIEKVLEFQLIGCSLENGKKLIIPGFTKIIRQPENTNTGYLEYVDIKNLQDNAFMKKVESFMKTIGYEGLFSLEFIRDKDGKNYFLEINMRNDGNAYCVTSAGVNLPYNWVLYKTQQKTEQTILQKEVFFIPEIEDFRLCVKKRFNLFLWIKQFHSATHAVFSLNDISPFIHQLYFVAKAFFVKNRNTKTNQST